jgi:hypothetical protein
LRNAVIPFSPCAELEAMSFEMLKAKINYHQWPPGVRTRLVTAVK